MLQVTTQLTATQLAHVHSAPPQLVQPAPAGMTYAFLAWEIQLIPGTTSFTTLSTQAWYAQSTLPVGAQLDGTALGSFLQGNTAQVAQDRQYPGQITNYSDAVGASICLYDPGSDDMTAGADTTASITIFYALLPLT
jgi:hypothetical protein